MKQIALIIEIFGNEEKNWEHKKRRTYPLQNNQEEQQQGIPWGFEKENLHFATAWCQVGVKPKPLNFCWHWHEEAGVTNFTSTEKRVLPRVTVQYPRYTKGVDF